jgi:hypothetical protein
LHSLDRYGTHMLGAVHAAACAGSSTFKSRGATTDDPLPEPADEMDGGTHSELLAKTARGRNIPLIADRTAAYAKSTACLEDVVRWFRGEHVHAAVCARCKRVCTISATRDLAPGRPNPNLGWWVVIDMPVSAVLELDEAGLCAAVAKAELHLKCEYGVGPKVGCKVIIENSTRRLNGKRGTVAAVDHDASPASFSVRVAGRTHKLRLDQLTT